MQILLLHPKFILIPPSLHLQSDSCNANSHCTLEYLGGERERGEALSPWLLLSTSYTAARTIL